MPTIRLLVGGLVAVGFSASGEHLLTVSHSGRGVFSTRTWERIARDGALAYPSNGVALGIGPIAGEPIPVVELTSERGVGVSSPNGQVLLLCESDGIEVSL